MVFKSWSNNYMNNEKLGEIVGASVATGVPVTPEQVTSVLTDEEPLQAVQNRGLVVGDAVITSTTDLVLSSEVTPPIAESLLEGFDQACQTYSFLLDAINGARAEAKGRKLEAVDIDTIRADVEALLTNEDLIAELQAEIDYFTANPEVDSPAPGFDIVIVPEGLTAVDVPAIAGNVQANITTDHIPSIRLEAFNDKRTPAVTGKGYRIAFAPRHYNVPKGTVATQKSWMNTQNQRTTATQLETATDAEALAYINGLADTKQLDNMSTRFDRTYFRRFDQAPRGDIISFVCVFEYGRLFLGESEVRNDYSTRALVVPKSI